MILIQQAELFSPAAQGRMDVLIAGGDILAIAPSLDLAGQALKDVGLTIIDGRGLLLTPGFVDSLVHFIGGGGEAGFASRTPEMQLTDATLGGVTTAVGALGTDSTTRTLTNLLAKAHALETEGISTFCHTGSYQVPCKTVTGQITDDILLIDKIIGVGEVAISDHRSSQPTIDELRKVAAQARVGGMLAGKGGTVSVHVGSGDSLLQPLYDAVAGTELQLKQFYPTHINRNMPLFLAGLQFARDGGVIDFTTSTTDYDLAHGEVAAAKALALALAEGISPMQLTMSSDGNASLPIFSAAGEVLGLEVGEVKTLHRSMVQAVREFDVPLASALTAITASPAAVLGLTRKGQVAVGFDADLLLLDAESLAVHTVIAKGKVVVADGVAVVKGVFER